jgi:hypothetical protein
MKDLSDGVESTEHAYSLIESVQVAALADARKWQAGALVSLIVGLTAPGIIGDVAFVAAAYALMAWLQLCLDSTGRFILLHQLALRDFMALPAAIDWGFLGSLLDWAAKPVHSDRAAASDEPSTSRH